VVLSAVTFLIPMPDFLVYVLFFLYGVNVSILFPLIITLTGLRFPDMAGTAMSFIKLGIPVAGIISPVLLSLLSRYAGFTSALYIFPAAGAVGFILSLINRKRLRLEE
jgi:MFS family permease